MTRELLLTLGGIIIIVQMFVVGRVIGSSMLLKQEDDDSSAVLGGAMEKWRKHQSSKRKKYIPETPKHIAELIASTNASYVRFLVDQLNDRARVYTRGPWDGGAIVVERYRLVLFTQGKVACTVLKQLARRMMELDDWMDHNWKVPHDPNRNGLSFLFNYEVMDALTILTSPRWTRAIFVRDPKERILSAYLDKVARN